MKKLMTAIFALSAMTTFASGTSNPDSTSVEVIVKATVKTKSQLIITSQDTANTGISEIAVTHVGDIDKTASSDLTADSAQHYIKRTHGEEILFDHTQGSVVISFETDGYFQMTNDIETTKTSKIDGRLTASTLSYNRTSKLIPFKVTSTLTRNDNLREAAAGSYTAQKTLTVTVNN